VATKVRFAVTFDGRKEALCLKGLLDVDDQMARGGPVTVLEADFYDKLAPSLSIRRPDCVATVVDRDAQFGIVIMRDVIARGGRFCTALEPFSPEQAAESLEQLARLHTARTMLGDLPWVRARIAELARAAYVPLPVLQEMLDGPRGEELPPDIRNAARLLDGLKVLAELDATRPHYLVHGDSHAGNIFRTADGPGLIDWQLLQRGGWALDVAYHIAAVLPVEVAEREERTLLRHYLDTMRRFDCPVPDTDEGAWAAYRVSLVYGYYLWSITRRVEPAIINLFVNRLGSAVARHDSYRLLGEPAR
jgi:Ser/Thr protein kinase RdoA (MazF antagonist)